MVHATRHIPGLIRRSAAAVLIAVGLLASPAMAEELELEIDELKFGFIKLTDMAPLAVAYELGYFEDEGLYVTLEPCAMCAGAVLFYEIPRIVIGDVTSYPGEVDWLRARGVEAVVEEDAGCIALLQRSLRETPDVWRRAVD